MNLWGLWIGRFKRIKKLDILTALKRR
jgi:hypothetical protein